MLNRFFPALLLASALGACSDTSFQGGVSDKGTPKGDVADADKDLNHQDAEELGKPGDETDLGTSSVDEPDCQPKALPLRLMVVLDVSSSMIDSLNVIKQNIESVAARLKDIKPSGSDKKIADVGLGMITFVEGARNRRVIPLTSNISAFTSTLAQTSIIDDPENMDFPEEGLPAVAQGLRLLAEAGNGKAIVPVLLVISDNYAHNGRIGPGVLNYSSNELDAAIGAKALRYLQLYDAVPTSVPSNSFADDVNTPTLLTPAQQWDQVRSTWKTKNPASTRTGGRSFGFPFSSTQLLEAFPTEVAKVLKVCD